MSHTIIEKIIGKLVKLTGRAELMLAYMTIQYGAMPAVIYLTTSKIRQLVMDRTRHLLKVALLAWALAIKL
jgi:hypothetical protein